MQYEGVWSHERLLSTEIVSLSCCQPRQGLEAFLRLLPSLVQYCLRRS